MAASKSPVFRIDFTLSFDREKYPSKADVEQASQIILEDGLKPFFYHYTEQWVLQLECTGLDNLHFQGRVNLKKKMRTTTFIKALESQLEEPSPFYRISASPTNVHCRSFSYVMKPETRISGPWANRPLFFGRSILLEKNLQLWHKRVVQMLEQYDEDPIEYRKLINFVDTKGGMGKTSLVRYLQHYYPDDVSYVDIWGTLSQISNSIVAEGSRKMYLADLPKSFNASSTSFTGNKVEQLSSLLERIKDGGPLKSTMRGGCTCLLFDPPITILFSNWRIDDKCFTPQRLVSLDLSQLVPTVQNDIMYKEYYDLSINWQWFFKTEENYNLLRGESNDHDNGVQLDSPLEF